MARQEQTGDHAWIEDRQYQTILRLTHTIAFEFDPRTGRHFVSPFITETLAGTYDDRQLSQVMLEDGVLHPEDVEKMSTFRDLVLSGECGSETVTMRLKTKTGEFRWYRMSLCASEEGGQGYPVVVGTISDVDEETRLRKRQLWQAQYDETTGIYNKRSFYAETERLLRAHLNQQYSLILFDVDRFKMINDMFGMEAGDLLLRFIGALVARLVHKEETYGRIRDDVFGLCVHRSKTEILQMLRELHAALSEYPLTFRMTLSIGIYCVEDPALPASILCDKATLAQRSVKGNAIDDYAFYQPEMGQAMAQEQKILSEMQEGIQTGQFQVYYQPKHRIADGKAVGAEALVRWVHPERGMIPPTEFIELFERNGLVIHLDKYVWESVCRSLRKWLDLGLHPLPISVNVSRVHLYDPDFCERFIALTDQYQIPPALLEIELTESAYVEYPRLGELMEILQARGFTFQMDDFGSGYSSLNMLRSIPVDALKLDLHFLGFSEEEPSGKIIMESIIQMANRLGIPIIAEGVETNAQAAFLLQSGCNLAQGFYYSHPMPCADYTCQYLQST